MVPVAIAFWVVTHKIFIPVEPDTLFQSELNFCNEMFLRTEGESWWQSVRAGCAIAQPGASLAGHLARPWGVLGP